MNQFQFIVTENVLKRAISVLTHFICGVEQRELVSTSRRVVLEIQVQAQSPQPSRGKFVALIRGSTINQENLEREIILANGKVFKIPELHFETQVVCDDRMFQARANLARSSA